MEDRILLLALRGRDADVIGQLLTKQGHQSVACTGVPDLANGLALGAATAIVTEESLLGVDHEPIWNWLGEQEAW